MHRQDLINLGYKIMTGKDKSKVKIKNKAKKLRKNGKIKSYRIDTCPLTKKYEIYYKI